MKKTASTASIALTITFCILIVGCTSEPTGEVVASEKLTIGTGLGPAATLLLVADDQGFFDQQHLNVEVVGFTAGKFAMQAFLAGSLDLAASGEVPVMYSSMAGNEFVVISQLVERTVGEVRIVARSDGDLNEPKEYFMAKKRKLATSFGGGPEFYTSEFLKKHGIEDVEIISQKPEDMPAALASGSVDAVAIFEPFATFSEQKLGDAGITFIDEDLYSELFVLNAHREWVQQHPEKAEALMRALVAAGAYIETNPEEAKAVLMRHTNLDKRTVDSMWDNFVFRPALNPRLMEYLEAEAKWAIETGKVATGSAAPDFSEYIWTASLSNVAPHAVTI
ncbi:MAG: NrtA/SsuA/CpmA family ABC transporter substrate-binding protein [archaeon]